MLLSLSNKNLEQDRFVNCDLSLPYPCSVRNIDRLNIDRMPGGNAQFELRKPREVNISVWAYSPDKSVMVGPLTEENNTAMLPDVIGSFDIQMEIPAQ